MEAIISLGVGDYGLPPPNSVTICLPTLRPPPYHPSQRLGGLYIRTTPVGTFAYVVYRGNIKLLSTMPPFYKQVIFIPDQECLHPHGVGGIYDKESTQGSETRSWDLEATQITSLWP